MPCGSFEKALHCSVDNLQCNAKKLHCAGLDTYIDRRNTSTSPGPVEEWLRRSVSRRDMSFSSVSTILVVGFAQ